MADKPASDPRMNGREQVLSDAVAEAEAQGITLEAVLLLTMIEALAMIHAAQLATLELQKMQMRGPGIVRPGRLG